MSLRTLHHRSYDNRFVKPGEILCNNIVVQQLSYLEKLANRRKRLYYIATGANFVPQEKGFEINCRFFPTMHKRNIALRTVKRFFYKDGERVKCSQGGVDLLKTFLVLDIRKTSTSSKIKVEFIEGKSDQRKKLKISIV